MKITKDTNGIRYENGIYYWEGNLISDEDLEIELDEILKVNGGIIAKHDIHTECDIIAGWGIRAGRGIRARGSVIAEDGIRAGYGISAGQDIKAVWDIRADEDIIAEKSIHAGWGIRTKQDISAGWDIIAGYDITAGGSISVGKRIFAGVSVCTDTKSCDHKIICRGLLSGEIAYGKLVIRNNEEE